MHFPLSLLSRSATLLDTNEELKRKADLAKILQKPQLEGTIEVLTRWGKLTYGKAPAGYYLQPTVVSSNEIRAASDGPPAGVRKPNTSIPTYTKRTYSKYQT